jgi:hypothetical protein
LRIAGDGSHEIIVGRRPSAYVFRSAADLMRRAAPSPDSSSPMRASMALLDVYVVCADQQQPTTAAAALTERAS